MKHLFFVLSLSGAFITASAQQILTPPADPGDIACSTIEVGMGSPITKKATFVFHNQADFNKYLKRIDELDLKKPEIDWTKQELIAIHFDGQSANGMSFAIKRVHRTSPTDVDVEVIANKGPQLADPPSTPLNLATKAQYPFAILATPIFTGKIHVRVVTG